MLPPPLVEICLDADVDADADADLPPLPAASDAGVRVTLADATADESTTDDTNAAAAAAAAAASSQSSGSGELALTPLAEGEDADEPQPEVVLDPVYAALPACAAAAAAGGQDLDEVAEPDDVAAMVAALVVPVDLSPHSLPGDAGPPVEALSVPLSLSAASPSPLDAAGKRHAAPALPTLVEAGERSPSPSPAASPALPRAAVSPSPPPSPPSSPPLSAHVRAAQHRVLEELHSALEARAHTLRQHGNDQLEHEYGSLSPVGVAQGVAAAKAHRVLNRYNNVLPYDATRVVLRPLPGLPVDTDYVNASRLVPATAAAPAVIAAQGPLPQTMAHFWHLVWQEDVHVVVMLTNEVEMGRPKCDRYWPDPAGLARAPGCREKTFGHYRVTHLGTEELPKYKIRRFEVAPVPRRGSAHRRGNGGNDGSTGSGSGSGSDDSDDSDSDSDDDEAAKDEGVAHAAPAAPAPRVVVQLHYTAWPDHGVPDTTADMLDFRAAVRACTRPEHGPIVVHCSAGVGRTGSFVAIDRLLSPVELALAGNDPAALELVPAMVRGGARWLRGAAGLAHRPPPGPTQDVLGVVAEMREARTLMVQTLDQCVPLGAGVAGVCGTGAHPESGWGWGGAAGTTLCTAAR